MAKHDITHEVVVHGLKKDKKETDKKYRNLLRELAKKDRELAAAMEIKGGVETFHIRPEKRSASSEATLFMVASDWHVAESVLKGQVNGLNEYNLEIAEERAKTFFVRGHKLLRIFKKDVAIKNVVLPLLGDFISNSIHDELMESNLLLPIDETIFAQKLIASGIEFLLEDKAIKNIVIPCHSGNHARTTKDRRIATERGNSLEYFMYHSLKLHFKNEPRVQFLVAEGYHSYLDVFGYTVRFHHGHNISYGGGVGGITISVNKAIAQWDKIKKADLDVFGHFHQFMDGGKFISNGSLIGYNAYALSIKASYEPPKQAMFLIDKKRGKTIVAPILFS